MTFFLDMWLIASYSTGKQDDASNPVHHYSHSVYIFSAYAHLCNCCTITWMVFGTLHSCCPHLTLLNIWMHSSFAFPQIGSITFFFFKEILVKIHTVLIIFMYYIFLAFSLILCCSFCDSSSDSYYHFRL